MTAHTPGRLIVGLAFGAAAVANQPAGAHKAITSS
jgi:hypothetical protein